MRGFTFVAAGALLTSVTAAVPLCAINCFQDVVAEHPPLDCTEPDMYHCFCKAPDLQRYFVECAYSDCPLTAESVEAVGFGVDLCAGLGLPITIDTEPLIEPTTPLPTVPTTTASPPKATDDDSTSETSEATETGSETNPDFLMETDSVDEPSDNSGPEPSGTLGGSGDDSDDGGEGSGSDEAGDEDGDQTTVTVSAANAKTVFGFLGFVGIAVAALV